MKLPVNVTFNVLAINVTVYDTTTVRVKGRSESVQGDDRVIRAIVQPASAKEQQYSLGGIQSDGALLIHTAADIYLLDSSQNTEEKKQTFLNRHGEIWRFASVENWSDYTIGNINKYIAIKYVNNTH